MRRHVWKAGALGAAWAAAPGNGTGYGGAGTSAGASGTGQPAASDQNTSSAGPGAGGAGSAGAGLGVGRLVSAAVQAALSGGATGTALAEAVHQVILTEKPNAKGLSVAMAVSQQLSSSAGSGSGTGSGSASSGSPGFADLSQTPWAGAAVDALAQGGVVNGTAPGQFSPNQPVTQAELVTMLARLQAGSAGSTSAAPPGTPAWAQDAMAWAAGSGVLSDVQGLAAPDAPLTRAQAVLMLLNAAGLGPVAATQASVPIQLSGNVPTWAHGALALAIQLGILQGSGGQLLADQPLTRAQMAVLLARLAVLQAQAASSGG